jgi:glycosyltransferase involved in cell wall biosynthesis
MATVASCRPDSMEEKNPKVTVLVPVFNRERLVEDAIRSVIEQDFDDFELLLVDDGSTDRTPEVLASWKERDPRVSVVTSPANQGLAAACNVGLAHARGKYVARLDSDDLMLPRRLAEQAAVLDTRPDVVLVSCAFDIVDLEGRHLGVWKNDEPPEVTKFLLNFFNLIGGAQLMFRLADVVAEGGYAVEFPVCEDYDLWVRMLRRGRIETLPLVGTTIRRHDSHLWAQHFKPPYWTRIMRSSLEPYLQRAVGDDEIAALITLWRRDGALGRGAIADRILQEAFARFGDEFPDRALRARVRKRIVSQWVVAAKNLARLGHRIEASMYLMRAARWLVR